MANAGICHPLAPHFAASGRYQVHTFDPVFGQFVAYADDLDEAVEVLWTHYQLDRRADPAAFLGVYDGKAGTYVHRWEGGRAATFPDLHSLEKMFRAASASGRRVLAIY